MKKVFIQLLFAILPLWIAAQEKGVENNYSQKKDTVYDEGKGVLFLDISYEQALKKAKAENKRIFVDCYASWCAPCKKMLDTTFKDTRIGNFMNYQFVTIKVTAKCSKTNSESKSTPLIC